VLVQPDPQCILHRQKRSAWSAHPPRQLRTESRTSDLIGATIHVGGFGVVTTGVRSILEDSGYDEK